MAYLHRRKQNEQVKKRRWWIHPILQRRNQLGEYHRLVMELELDSERWKKYFRVSKEQFEHLLHMIGNDIQKQSVNYRQATTPRERLAICMR